MRLFSIIIFFLICCTIPVSAQFDILWQQCYGTTDLDRPQTIIPYEDGYLLGGKTEGTDWFRTCDSVVFPYPEVDPGWLVMIDSSGVFKSDHCFENLQVFKIAKQQGTENLYFIGGGKMEEYPDASNISIMKTDSELGIIWEKFVGCPAGLRYHLGGIYTFDGGCMSYCTIKSGGGDVSVFYGTFFNVWLAKFNESGDLMWDYTFGNSNGNTGIHDIIQTADSGYIASMYGNTNGPPGSGNIICYKEFDEGYDMILYKIDKDGNPLWQRCYGGSHHDALKKVIELEDGYLICGYTDSSDGDMLNSGYHWVTDVWIAKIDFDGNIIWQKCYGGTDVDVPNDIKETSDGGFIVFARTESDDCDVQGNINDAGHSIWIFKIDANGELLWQKSIQSLGREEVHDVYQKSDTRYVLAGEMWYSPSYDVNCSNYIPFSWGNYYALEIEITDGGVGQEELFSADDIQLYPNPATSSFTIEMPKKMISPSALVEVYDMNGTLCLSSFQYKKTRIYDVSTLAKGFYVVRVRNSDFVRYKKFIIR